MKFKNEIVLILRRNRMVWKRLERLLQPRDPRRNAKPRRNSRLHAADGLHPLDQSLALLIE